MGHTLGVLEVVAPERADLVLAANVPHREADVLVLDRLDVEAYAVSGRRRRLPMVGIVVTISPSLSLYRIVVLPAASRPTIRMRISFLPNRPANNLEIEMPT